MGNQTPKFVPWRYSYEKCYGEKASRGGSCECGRRSVILNRVLGMASLKGTCLAVQ